MDLRFDELYFLVFLFSLLNSCTDRNKNYLDGGYYQSVYLADSLFFEGQYETSYKTLSKLFEEYEPINIQMYEEYRTYVYLHHILQKKDGGKTGLKQLIKKYGLTKKNIQYDSVLNLIYLRDSNTYNNKYESWRTKYLSSINITYRDLIKEMTHKDQQYRTKRESGINTIKERDSIDSLNFKRIEILIPKYGYPSPRTIGNFNVDNKHVDLETILLHIKSEDKIRFIDKLYPYLKSGDINPITYGRILDKYFIWKTGKQKYGTFGDVTGGLVELLESSHKVDSLRKTIGLPSMNYESWRRNQVK